ncbi:sensor domain-containing diguanylate cyclase [Pseudidiomarina aquimaris]|uniref:GGDEF domain-containing protein n=1 Tax=Pseudidiomarina aquimaris TaxID=641841 RepID=UPI0013005701|nr:GGDEF domain-containing protein [Pseudidiomarina aquimaris]
MLTATTHQSIRHQAQLLKAVLKIVVLFSLLIGSLNVFVFAAFMVATFNFLTAFFASAILFFYNRSANLRLASWLTCLAVIFNVAVFIHLADGRNYSILWVMIIPPIVFFLLGKQIGAWLTAGVFAYSIALMAYQLQQPRQETQGLGALLNIIEVCTALWFLFRFYEGSRQAAYRELESLSATDKLTGLANRSKLDNLLLDVHQKRRDAEISSATVVICDIDHFKRINDEFGHLEGDRVLQALARQLKAEVGDQGVVGRWGGEEFMFIFSERDVASTVQFCEHLRTTIQNHSPSSKRALTLSFGIAQLHPQHSIEHALLCADRALYRAKQDGRNCVRCAERDV